MGLDDDLKYKVWIPKEFKDSIYDEIEKTINKTMKNKAPEFLKHVQVVGLDKPFNIQRDAGMTLLPGLKLIFTNGAAARLTAFFTDGSDLYAISTTHLNDLTRQPVWYETEMGLFLLGKIVCHVAEGDPFREACLIKIDEARIDDISEYINDTTTSSMQRFVCDIYRGGVKTISRMRPSTLMNTDPGKFHVVKFKKVVDKYDRGQLLKDCVLWTGGQNVGQVGQSGSGFYGKSNEEVDLVAMYIGRGEVDDKQLLVSHTMTATIDYFNSKISGSLRVYNPQTRPVTGADI